MKNNRMRHFLTLWSGQLLSSVGTGLSAFSLGAYSFRQTGSATAYSLMILFAYLPSVLLKPLGGILSDRFNRRILMIIGNMGSAVVMFLLFLLLHWGRKELWILYAGTLANSLFNALHNPAFKASVTDLLDENSYSRAGGYLQLAESVQFVLSPVLAGVLLKIFEVEVLLVLDMCTFLFASMTVLRILSVPLPAVIRIKGDSFLKDLNMGWQSVIGDRSLRVLLFLTALISFFIGLLQSLLGPMILAWGSEQTLGLITTLSATGMILSSIVLGIFPGGYRKLPQLSAALVAVGIFYSSLGISTGILPLVISGFLFFCALPFVNTALDVLVRRRVDRNMQGRVWSLVSLITQLGMLLAFGLAGILADRFFNPLFLEDRGAFSFLRGWIGTGPGRGIGFMFVISGIGLSITGLFLGRLKVLKPLDEPAGEEKSPEKEERPCI